MEHLDIKHIKISICIAVDYDGKYYTCISQCWQDVSLPITNLGVKCAYNVYLQTIVYAGKFITKPIMDLH